jgi:putative DNA methylase
VANVIATVRIRRCQPDTSMLDAGTLPVAELAALAEREGRRRVPIYQAHRWFARRFSSAIRAILTAAKLSSTADFWRAYYHGVNYAGDTVLDPFVGGGTSVVEAARLGARTVGVDIDPVACAITRFELRAVAVPDLSSVIEELQRAVGSRLAGFYRSSDIGGNASQMLHGFWVQVVTCHRCGKHGEAHPHFQLAYQSDGERQWVFCQRCHRVRELDRSIKSFRCVSCRLRTEIDDGTVVHGRYRCPTCGAEEDLIDVAARTGRPPTWRLFALETIAAGSNQRRVLMADRSFRAATDADRDRVRAASRALAHRRAGADHLRWIPNRRIPTNGRSDNRLIQYGYARYRDLFNPRQLLHLSLLSEAIDALAWEAREAMALAFSDHLTTNCMLTQYAFGWRRLAPLFSIRAFRHVCRPVEINPWLDGTGRGTFPNTVRQVQRAVAFARAPEVAHVDGGFLRSGSFDAADAPARIIYNGDSRLLAEVDEKSVSLILTDPPYCDNIAYSELSDFFLPWLQQFGLAPGSRTTARLAANLAAQSRRDAAVATFREGLSACFVQMRRVLKDDGRLVFSYQHRTPDAWEALATALATGGWQPIQVFPLLGNSTAGLHQHDKTILWDAVTVCRKAARPARSPNLQVNDEGVRHARKLLSHWTTRLSKAGGPAFRAADRENFFRAALVASAIGMDGYGRGSSARPLLDVLATTLAMASN